MKNNKKSESVDKIGIASSLKAAASKTKLPAHIIQKARSLGSDAFAPNGRIDCDALIEFVATMPETPGTSDAPDYYVERAKDVRANRLLKEQKLAERSKALIPFEAVRRDWFQYVFAAKHKLYAAENEIVVEAAMRLGFTQTQIDDLRKVIAAHHRRIIGEMHKGEWGRVICPKCNSEFHNDPKPPQTKP